jgi:predicted NAD/FAD-binding protein
VVTRSAKAKDGAIQIQYKDMSDNLEIEPQTAYFDQLILAIDADSCLKLLGNEATFLEKRVLGNVKYLYDVTITHNDLAYMKKVC